MKKLLVGVSGLAVVLIIGTVALPSLVPSEVYKEKIETQLSKELERDVRVIGEIKLSVFPLIKANAGRVEIDNPEGFKDAQFASMDGMSARVKLLPLLSKQVEIAAFTLKNPIISLEKNSTGDMNWAFGDPESKPVKTDEGPFKRDGRYVELDPSIGNFSIENGTIKYSDAVKGESHTLNAVNLDLSLASLSAPLDVNGGFVYKEIPAKLNLKLNSIRAFLDGEEAPVSLSLKTEFADISSKGKILAGEDIQFNLDLDADISDVAKLLSFSPVEVPYSDLANAVKISGNYNFDGKTLSVNNADIALAGSGFDAGFKGQATLAQPPVFDGRVTLDARDVQTLAKALDQDIKALELIQTAKFVADLKAQDKGFAANNIDASIQGDGLKAEYTGSAIISENITATGLFSAETASVPSLLKSLEMDIPQATLVESLSAKGNLNYSDDLISLSALDIKTNGGAVTGSYTGDVKLIDGEPALDGQFSVDIPSVAEANKIADLKIDAANLVGNLNASGRVNLAGKNISITNITAKTQGDIINGEYNGSAKLGDIVGYDGNFTASLSSLNEISNRSNIVVPFANTVGTINVEGNISGQGETLRLSSLDASLTDGQINGKFTGAASMNDGFDLDGNLSADIPSLRNLAATTGTNSLPPSTNTGPIYERFTVSGKVKGNPAEITFKSATIELDALKGTGDFTIDLKNGTPEMNATMNMNGLDIRPYMAAYSAQRPTGEIQPWSEAPIDTAPLRTFNGNFTFNTPDVVTNRMALGQTTISATLSDGVMVADLPNMTLYGGNGRMNAVLDGSGSVPSVSLDMGLKKVNSADLFDAAAGFTNATGEVGSAFKIEGSGQSQADIMKSLSGSGDFRLLDGQILGVDLESLLSGLDQAISSRAVPSGIGASHVTTFKDILGLFTITNGVASVNEFSLSGAGVLAEGSGKIDLGNQYVDFSIRPRLTGKSASDIASFGIPIQAKGDFGDVKIGLDTSVLGDIIAERARAKAARVITDQLGGSALGNVIGGVVGGNSESSSITSILGGVLGGSQQSTNQQGTQPAESESTTELEPKAEAAPETEAPAPIDLEEEAINGLKSLFGKKKKGE